MPKPANKPVIAVDIDEVIFPMVDNLIAYLEKEHKVKVSPEEFTTYNLEDIWQGGPIEGAQIFEAYKQQNGIDVAPVKGAAEALEQLSRRYDIIVMTSRDISVEAKTHDWINHHFPEVFSHVHLLGNKHDSDVYGNKADVCKEMGVFCLIDDNLKAVIETHNTGVKALLFGDYPWNHTKQLPAEITRVKNWQEVLEFFENEKG